MNEKELAFIVAFEAWLEKEGKHIWLNSKEATAMMDAWKELKGVKA